MSMNWNECSDAFHKDGSLRDIYVHGTTFHDWESFLSFLASSSYQIEYVRDGEPEAIPTDAATVFADGEHTDNLTIRVTGLSILCHFFTPEEIELDLDPREVTSQEHLDALLRFMSDVGAVLRHDVILTEENGPEAVRFRYSVEEEEVKYIGIS